MCAAAAAMAALSLTADSSSRLLLGALAVIQTLGVAALFATPREGGHGARWATCTSVVAATWVVLFLLPAWIYWIDPNQLGVPLSPLAAVALTNLSLFALVAGHLLSSGGRPRGTRTIAVTGSRRERQSLTVGLWFVAAGASLGVIFALNGGPASYLSNLDDTGRMNAGLTYFVWIVFAAKYAAISRAVWRWSRGNGLTSFDVTVLVAAFVVVGLVGARAFLAIGLTQLLLAYVLVRRPVGVLPVALGVLLALVVLVFGYGSLKRYQAYDNPNPDGKISFVTYLRTVAVDEALEAYTQNYVDAGRSIALAMNVVPADASFEHGKLALRLALQVIPGPLRPDVGTDPVVAGALRPNRSHTAAVPLQVAAYLQFGIPAVLLCFVLLGLLLSQINRLLALSTLTLPAFVALLGAVTGVPMLLRSGAPIGFVFAALDVVGFYAVAWTLSRP